MQKEERETTMKNMKRAFALLLVLAMVVSMFTACKSDEPGSNKTENVTDKPDGNGTVVDPGTTDKPVSTDTPTPTPTVDPEAVVDATAVPFSKEGKYTVTVTGDGVDLSGVTADNTEVTYIALALLEESYDEDEEEAPAEEAGSGEASSDRYTYEDGEVKAKIEEIKANGNGWDITFTDEYATEFVPAVYGIIFRDIDKIAYVDVEFKNMSVVSETKEVNASAKEAKITLVLEGSEFEEGVSADDIVLEKAFQDMSIESISASGKNLTMQLKGSIVRNPELNFQECGTVTVKPSAVKDGYVNLSADVAVLTEAAYFDSASLSAENGKVTATLIAYDSVDLSALTKDNIVIDGVTVEAFEKKDDHTATVTFTADSVNAFAAIANGKTMNLGGYEAEIYLPQVSFYPVFDYCEENGDTLKLTLIAYASSGTFDSSISADSFVFGKDFEGAEVVSVERLSDITAKLIISVSANGQTMETLNMEGEITLAADALVNNWGEKPAEAAVNSRVYSGETLGKANQIILSKNALLEIQKYTRGRNTLLGELCYWGGNAGTVFSLVKTGLEVLGVLESDHAAIMREFRQINAKLDAIQDTLNAHTLKLEAIDKHLYEQDLKAYSTALESMLANYRDLVNLYKNARDDYAPELYIVGEELPKKMQAEGTEPKAWLDWENATDKERAAYSDALTDICLEGSDNRNSRYYGFSTKRDALVSDFHTVVTQLTKHDVFGAVDTFASMEYNFDTQAYYFRCSYRENALASLEKVMALLHIIYKTDSDPYNYVFEGLNDEFLSAVDVINKNAVTSLAPEDVDVVPRTVTIKKTVEDMGYISEVKLFANKSKDEAKKALTKEGYTLIDKDLNEKAGGDYIYLGYKKTDKYEDAIKDFTILVGESKKDVTVCQVGDIEYQAVTANFNRDLNKGAGGDFIYLFYTKTEMSDKKGVQEITFNATKKGSVCTKDLNDNAGGSDIYMHLSRYAKGATVEYTEQRGSDPQYHPYCYTFGQKVRIGTSKGNKEYYSWNGVLVSEKSQRKLTDVEYKGFMQRIKADTIKGELADAGIKLTLPLIMNMSKKSGSESVSGAKQHKSYTYYVMSGDLLMPDSITVTSGVKLAKLFASTKRRSHNERYQEFTYFYLD